MTGYKVVRVPFKDRTPASYYEISMAGLRANNAPRCGGTAAALAIAKDGSLLVADDTGSTIWKVSYTGAAPAGALGRNDRHGRRPRQEVSTHGARDRPPQDGPRLPISGALGRCHRSVCVAAALQTIRVKPRPD